MFAVCSAFFPGQVSVRARGLTACPSPGADAVGGTTHGLRCYRPRPGAGRATWSGPLRPRNRAGPSSRPPPQGGCPCAGRPGASGAGRGRPRPLGRPAPPGEEPRGGPIHRRALRGDGPLGSSACPAAAPPAWQRPLLRHPPGTARAAAGSPTPLPPPGATGAERRPGGVVPGPRRHAPAAGPAASTLGPGPVFAPGGPGPAGWARSPRPAAAEQAHGRAAWPLLGPAVPSRWPAAAMAHWTRRPEARQACTRGKRWLSWRAYRRTRRPDGPEAGHRREQSQGLGGVRRRRFADGPRARAAAAHRTPAAPGPRPGAWARRAQAPARRPRRGGLCQPAFSPAQAG
jgi:hypothetical protein